MPEGVSYEYFSTSILSFLFSLLALEAEIERSSETTLQVRLNRY